MEIVTKDGFQAIKTGRSAVAVLLYTLDENDLLDKVGIVTEKNPFFSDGAYTGLILGTVEHEDPSLIYRAKKEALEEAGYDISDNSRWDFMGELYTSKMFPSALVCYSADVTGLKGEKPKGDGSEQEDGIKFNLVSLAKARKIQDSVLQSCLFNLFMKLYKTEILS